MQNDWKSFPLHNHKSFIILGLNQRLIILWTFFWLISLSLRSCVMNRLLNLNSVSIKRDKIICLSRSQ